MTVAYLGTGLHKVLIPLNPPAFYHSPIGTALTAGGTIYIIGQVLDDTHTTPPEAVGFNLIFLNTFYAGESYTEREYRTWLRAAGFVDIERAPFLLRDGFG